MNHCRYAIISGSTRPNSQSRKVADFISKTLLGNSQVKLVQLDFLFVKNIQTNPTILSLSLGAFSAINNVMARNAMAFLELTR
jgi:hypothetical protein